MQPVSARQARSSMETRRSPPRGVSRRPGASVRSYAALTASIVSNRRNRILLQIRKESTMITGNEADRVRQAYDDTAPVKWLQWGPYLSERQWATVREDYSPY